MAEWKRYDASFCGQQRERYKRQAESRPRAFHEWFHSWFFIFAQKSILYIYIFIHIYVPIIHFLSTSIVLCVICGACHPTILTVRGRAQSVLFAAWLLFIHCIDFDHSINLSGRLFFCHIEYNVTHDGHQTAILHFEL